MHRHAWTATTYCLLSVRLTCLEANDCTVCRTADAAYSLGWGGCKRAGEFKIQNVCANYFQVSRFGHATSLSTVDVERRSNMSPLAVADVLQGLLVLSLPDVVGFGSFFAVVPGRA